MFPIFTSSAANRADAADQNTIPSLINQTPVYHSGSPPGVDFEDPSRRESLFREPPPENSWTGSVLYGGAAALAMYGARQSVHNVANEASATLGRVGRNADIFRTHAINATNTVAPHAIGAFQDVQDTARQAKLAIQIIIGLLVLIFLSIMYLYTQHANKVYKYNYKST